MASVSGPNEVSVNYYSGYSLSDVLRYVSDFVDKWGSDRGVVDVVISREGLLWCATVYYVKV